MSGQSMYWMHSMQSRLNDRANWPSGSWDHEPDRVEWIHQGIPCLMTRGGFGAWCGYAGVRPDHPLYGVPFDAPIMTTLDVHGNLTYSFKCHEHICHDAPGDDVWWLGFDCGHALDVAPGLETLLGREYPPIGTYKDLEYVRAEVNSLAEQLHDLR